MRLLPIRHSVTSTTRSYVVGLTMIMLGLGFTLIWISMPISSQIQLGASLRGRRLDSTHTDVPTDPSFDWNGNTSDLAQQFYVRHAAGATAEALKYSTSDLPSKIQDRLVAADLRFEDLPGLLQRAVIWDTGYTFDASGDFIKVYTINGVSMAELAVSIEDYYSANCTTKNCSDPDGYATYRSETCSGDQMLSVSKCASEEVTIQGGHMSMWATGGDPEAIPTMNMVRHSWYDLVYHHDYLVFAIHTITSEDEPAWDSCNTDTYGSIIIPCAPYSDANAASMNWQEPAEGAIVNAWLKLAKEEQPEKFRMIMVLPIALASILFFAGAIGYLRYKRRRNAQVAKDKFIMLSSPTGKGGSSFPSDSTVSRGYLYATSAKHVASVLLNDVNLHLKRLAIEKIVFQDQIAKGAFGEVWLSQYEGSIVAVKRLLKTKRQTFDDIQAFTEEIQLTSSLDHPNVIQFIGVAWNTLENLCMVMEYLPNGDLQVYLRKNAETLTWPDDKLPLAIGVARAVEYLHARSAPIIHRDIKARNVLLTATFEAKLIDFGVSRSFGDGMMTMGVGTPYWTAPEVLDGTKYTEKSDIYSFGVLLSELDTCSTPYHDAKTVRQEELLQPFHILKLVIAGCLQPNFNNDCPPKIQEIAGMCLERNPSDRPSAQDVVAMLEAAACMQGACIE